MFYQASISYVEDGCIFKPIVLVDAISFTDVEVKLNKEYEHKHALAIRSIRKKVIDEMLVDTNEGTYCDVVTLTEDPETNKVILIKNLVEVVDSIKEVFDKMNNYNEKDFVSIHQTKISKIIL